MCRAVSKWAAWHLWPSLLFHSKVNTVWAGACGPRRPSSRIPIVAVLHLPAQFVWVSTPEICCRQYSSLRADMTCLSDNNCVGSIPPRPAVAAIVCLYRRILCYGLVSLPSACSSGTLGLLRRRSLRFFLWTRPSPESLLAAYIERLNIRRNIEVCVRQRVSRNGSTASAGKAEEEA